ncbi:hypothetical protein ACCP91_21800 (plasmid) [Xanthomonas axonopodis pv. cyamopsidis]|uniref:hypothetical protein n=1 Tax=Xanthomonas axonopodis TaxID=53413 RepID=UPI0035574BFF
MNANALHAANTAADDRLPAPKTEDELRERIGELESSIAAGEWEGVTYTPAMRDVLKRYALGEIGWSQLGKEIVAGD